MKALVTGGAGFIGSWIVDFLVNENFDVVVIDNLSSGSLKNFEHLEDKIAKVNFYEKDIRSLELWEIFEKEKPDYVFHAAAEISVRDSIENPRKCEDVNVVGSLNVLRSCAEYGVKKFIFSSTGGAIYGDGVRIPTPETEKEKPASPYGISKLTLEKYLDFFKTVHGLDYVSLRYSNVYGPRQNADGEAGVVAIFIDNLLSGKKPRINGSGNQTRDYIYVKDVAGANLLALNDSLSGIFNVGTGIETDVNELYRRITKIMNLNVQAENMPAIKGEQMRSCLDAGKLIDAGWCIKYNLESGLQETICSFRGKVK